MALHLSLRQKLALWAGLAVFVTALTLTLAVMVQSYRELQQDMLVESMTLGQALIPELAVVLQSHDARRAQQVLGTVLRNRQATPETANVVENLILVDSKLQVLAAAAPENVKTGVALAESGAGLTVIDAQLRHASGKGMETSSFDDTQSDVLTMPIYDDGRKIGALIIVREQIVFLPRYQQLAKYCLLGTLAALALVLPLSHYWGRRLARPLIQLAECMERSNGKLPERLAPELYSAADEIGSLLSAYNRMLTELQARSTLAEHATAFHRLAANMAQDLGNPLGGVLIAIDTLKKQTANDERATKTIALLERGIEQVKQKVEAMTVEAG